MSFLLLIGKDLLDLPRWLKLTIAALIALLAFGLYERHVGKAACEASVAAATASAERRANDLQAKLDELAGQDKALKAALDAVPRPLPPIKFGCQFTPGELALIRERLK